MGILTLLRNIGSLLPLNVWLWVGGIGGAIAFVGGLLLHQHIKDEAACASTVASLRSEAAIAVAKASQHNTEIVTQEVVKYKDRIIHDKVVYGSIDQAAQQSVLILSHTLTDCFRVLHDDAASGAAPIEGGPCAPIGTPTAPKSPPT